MELDPDPPRHQRLSFRRYWLALYRRDVATADYLVDQALARMAPRRIYHRIFAPALVLSGSLFARGSIRYCDEHFVTHHILRLMRRVRRVMRDRPPTGPIALATGVGQESHLIGLRMVCDCLAEANWRIRWTATHERGVLRDAVRQHQPRAVLVSIGLRRGVTPAARLVEELRRIDYPGVVAVGGGAILADPALVQQLGADLTAPNGTVLLRRLKQVSANR